mmetsp:Transcript_15323/g.30757  ORF Transcript_15323/g.30757 Transcript_15323/m.30757 type:complete len:405 (+) Transcript_15323:951-2165(+)
MKSEARVGSSRSTTSRSVESFERCERSRVVARSAETEREGSEESTAAARTTVAPGYGARAFTSSASTLSAVVLRSRARRAANLAVGTVSDSERMVKLAESSTLVCLGVCFRAAMVCPRLADRAPLRVADSPLAKRNSTASSALRVLSSASSAPSPGVTASSACSSMAASVAAAKRRARLACLSVSVGATGRRSAWGRAESGVDIGCTMGAEAVERRVVEPRVEGKREAVSCSSMGGSMGAGAVRSGDHPPGGKVPRCTTGVSRKVISRPRAWLRVEGVRRRSNVAIFDAYSASRACTEAVATLRSSETSVTLRCTALCSTAVRAASTVRNVSKGSSPLAMSLVLTVTPPSPSSCSVANSPTAAAAVRMCSGSWGGTTAAGVAVCPETWGECCAAGYCGTEATAR